MIKVAFFLLACFVLVFSQDVIHHYGKHGGNGVSSRYFIKSQGHDLGYGGFGLGNDGYGFGYGGFGLGNDGYGYGYGGYGNEGYGGYDGYGLGFENYGAGYGGYGRYGYGF